MAYLRQNASTECEQQLQQLTNLEDQATPSQLVQIAQLFAHVERYAEALRCAYRAARQAPQEKLVAQVYIAIFSQCERSGLDLDMDRIAAGTWVTLESSAGDELQYTIVDPLLEDPQADEFTPDSTAVRDIVDLRAGDTIIRQQGTERETEFTVRESKTLFVHIFQDLLINYHRRHPDSLAIQGVRLPEETIGSAEDPLLRSVMERRELAEAVLDIYRRHEPPLGSVAARLGVGIGDVYAEISRRPDLKLSSEYPFPVEFAAATKLASDSERILLTRSALITVAELELHPLFEEGSRSMLVPQSLLDELQMELQVLGSHAEAGSQHLVAGPGGSFAMVERTPREIREEQRRIESCIDWVRETCRVEPVPSESIDETFRSVREQLGNSTADTYLIALEMSVPVYADDLGIRRLELSPFNDKCEGFSTAALIWGLLRVDGIDEERGLDVLVELVRRDHYFVPVNAAMLKRALEKTGYQVDDGILKLFDRLRGTHSATGAAISVAAELLCEIALSPAAGSIGAVATLCFECLADGHPSWTLEVMRQECEARLHLLPMARDRVMERWEAFRRLK